MISYYYYIIKSIQFYCEIVSETTTTVNTQKLLFCDMIMRRVCVEWNRKFQRKVKMKRWRRELYLVFLMDLVGVTTVLIIATKKSLAYFYIPQHNTNLISFQVLQTPQNKYYRLWMAFISLLLCIFATVFIHIKYWFKTIFFMQYRYSFNKKWDQN